jgi:purine-binding chemotaxis protein CheW
MVQLCLFFMPTWVGCNEAYSKFETNMTANHSDEPLVPAPVASLTGKYLTFQLGRECYGFPVLKVREIIRYVAPTVVAQLPEHVKGVINLRGKIVPVVDLRLKFGFPADVTSDHVCIVVVQIATATGRPAVMGMVVDGVEEVVQVSTQEIEPAPDFGAGLDTQYILGMAKIRGTVKTLLDMDKLLTTETIETIHKQAGAQPSQTITTDKPAK